MPKEKCWGRCTSNEISRLSISKTFFSLEKNFVQVNLCTSFHSLIWGKFPVTLLSFISPMLFSNPFLKYLQTTCNLQKPSTSFIFSPKLCHSFDFSVKPKVQMFLNSSLYNIIDIDFLILTGFET